MMLIKKPQLLTPLLYFAVLVSSSSAQTAGERPSPYVEPLWYVPTVKAADGLLEEVQKVHEERVSTQGWCARRPKA